MNAVHSFLWVAVLLSGCAPRGRASVAPSAARHLVAPLVVPGELQGRNLLGDLPVRAAHLGAGPASLVASGEALDNEWLGGFVEVPAESCLLAYARASSSVEDIDVAVYSEEGTSLAVDEGRDVHPTVVLCPPHPPRVYVAAHVVEGEGLIATGVQLVPRDRAQVVARALGAHGTLEQGPRAADAWPGLDDAVRVHRIELGGKWEEFKRVALPVDARVPTYASLPFGADQCVDAVVVPDDDVALLDVEAIDEEGRVIGRAPDGMGARTLTICSPLAMAGTLQVRPHSGRGLAAVVLARAAGDVAQDLSSRPEIAWVAPTVPLEVAKRARNAILAKSGYSAPAFVASGVLGLGHRVTVALEPKAFGTMCGRIDVVAGAPLSLVEARVWGDGDSLLADGEASSSLAMFACPRGAARLELEARGRPGPYAVLVRPEPWKHPSLSLHPLASSRMLARAAVGQEMLLSGKEGVVRELALDEARTISWTEDVPPGRCLRVAVGAQGEGAGLELRAFEGPDAEIDRAQAAHAASVRACAQDTARTIRFEVHASAGRLDAVLGERIESSDSR